MNVPQNWSYVGSTWSLWLMGLTLLPELAFPFAYLKILKEQEVRESKISEKKRI